MHRLAAALVVIAAVFGSAVAEDASGQPAPAGLDDAAFDAQFVCPENLATADDRIDEVARYLGWAKARHPDWSVKKTLDVRYGLLRRHNCTKTLANIQNSGR